MKHPMLLFTFLAPLGAVLIWSGNMTINQLTVGTIAPSSMAFLWMSAIRQIGASQASLHQPDAAISAP
jgi:hypothetical protein